jgi:hypothetical protein
LKAKDLLPLLQSQLDPELDVHRIEETQDAITVNIIGGRDSLTVVGKIKIIVKPIKEEQEEHAGLN